jgi:hypothetical protein
MARRDKGPAANPASYGTLACAANRVHENRRAARDAGVPLSARGPFFNR